MKTALVGCIAASLGTATAQAGFAGFVAYSRNYQQTTIIDVFAATTNANDKFLAILDTTSNGDFIHKAGRASKTWKPDIAGFSSNRNTIYDSFMTAGTFSGGAYGGEYYASSNSVADPNFTGTSWNATPASPAATTIPNNAGWYTADPTSADNNAENMAVWGGSFTRTNSVYVAGFNAGTGATAAATHGIWIAHLVVAGNNKLIGVDFTFAASASIKDGMSGATNSARYQFIPSPSALALLSLSGLASRRRRS